MGRKSEYTRIGILMLADLVVNMLFSFTVEEYFRNGLDENMLLKKLGDSVKMLEEGLRLPVLFDYKITKGGYV